MIGRNRGGNRASRVASALIAIIGVRFRRRTPGPALALALAIIAATTCLPPPLAAQLPRASQQRVASPGETQFNLDFLRPSGGPVIPIFEGWYRMPDGSHALSFGYFNVNTEEILEIPLGPDNFIEPAVHDGVQPTHFLPVPEGDRRHWGVFTVTVPSDFGDGDVVWTLRHDGRTYSVPGRIRSPHYQINGWVFPGRESSSPVLRLERDGAGAQGPAGISAEPVRATPDEPGRLVVWVHRDGTFPDDRRPIRLKWFKHRGPGRVVFSEPEAEVPHEAWSAEGGAAVSTRASFSEPGGYVVRVLAYNRVPEFEFQCCWTNGYLHVEVGR